MTEKKEEKKFVELWPGKKVEVTRLDLLKDFDYLHDLTKQMKENDPDVITTLFALIGGDEPFNQLREHTIAEKGIFELDAVNFVTKQLLDLIPKASSSSSNRW